MKSKQIRRALQHRRTGESVKESARRIATDREHPWSHIIGYWLQRKGCKVE